MNKKYGIMGLILIVVLTTVMVSGCIGGDTEKFNKEFTNKVTFKGETFYLPDGFELTNESSYYGFSAKEYSDGTYGILIGYYPLSKSKILSNMKSQSDFSNIDESVSYGGYSGFSADYRDSGYVYKYFVFEKGGKTFVIGLTGLDLDKVVPKVIG